MPHEPGHTFDQAAEQYTSAYTLANMIKDIEGIKEAYKDSSTLGKGATFLKNLFTGKWRGRGTGKGVISAEQAALRELKTKIIEKYAKQLRDTQALSEERSMKDAEEAWNRALDIVDAKPIDPSWVMTGTAPQMGDVASKASRTYKDVPEGASLGEKQKAPLLADFKPARSGWARNPEYDPTLPEKPGVKEFVYTGTGDYTEDGTYMPGAITGSPYVYELPRYEGMMGGQGFEGMPTHVARGDEYVADPLSAYQQKDLDLLLKGRTSIDMSILNKAIEAEKKKGTEEGDAKAAELEEKKKEVIEKGSKLPSIDPTKPKDGTPPGTPPGTAPDTDNAFYQWGLDPKARRSALGQVSMQDYTAGLPSFLPGGGLAPMEATYQNMMPQLNAAYKMSQRLGLTAPDPESDAGETGTFGFEQWLRTDPDIRGIVKTGLDRLERLRAHLNQLPDEAARNNAINNLPFADQQLFHEYLTPTRDADGNIINAWAGAERERNLRMMLNQYLPEATRYAANEALRRRYRQGMVSDPLNQYNMFQGMGRPGGFGESAYPINPAQPAPQTDIAAETMLDASSPAGAENYISNTGYDAATAADIDALDMSYNLGGNLGDISPMNMPAQTTPAPTPAPTPMPMPQGPTFVKHPQDPVSTPMTTAIHQPGTFSDQAYWNRQRDLGNIQVPPGMQINNMGQFVPMPGQNYVPGYAAKQILNPGYDARMHWEKYEYPTGMKLG